MKYTMKQRREYAQAKLDLVATGRTDNLDLLIKQVYRNNRLMVPSEISDQPGLRSAIGEEETKRKSRKINANLFTREEINWAFRTIENEIYRFSSEFKFNIFVDDSSEVLSTFIEIINKDNQYALTLPLPWSTDFKFGYKIKRNRHSIELHYAIYNGTAKVVFDSYGLSYTDAGEDTLLQSKCGRLMFRPEHKNLSIRGNIPDAENENPSCRDYRIVPPPDA